VNIYAHRNEHSGSIKTYRILQHKVGQLLARFLANVSVHRTFLPRRRELKLEGRIVESGGYVKRDNPMTYVGVSARSLSYSIFFTSQQ
jgi:hypothetical protein